MIAKLTIDLWVTTFVIALVALFIERMFDRGAEDRKARMKKEPGLKKVEDNIDALIGFLFCVTLVMTAVSLAHLGMDIGYYLLDIEVDP